MKARSTAKPELSRQHGSTDRGGPGLAQRAPAVADSRPEMEQQQGLLSLMAGSPRLQRKCACGAPSAVGGSCSACELKTTGAGTVLLQKQLAVGAQDDPLEREADLVADQVMRMEAPGAAVLGPTPPRIQRLGSHSSRSGSEMAPASVEMVLAGSGRPLEPGLQQEMELRFGYDFSKVRVHTGAEAAESARDLNADAYTVGWNIVFAASSFSPSAWLGRRLIAHELTHVIQQGGANIRPQGQGSRRRSVEDFEQSASLETFPGTHAPNRLVTTPAQDTNHITDHFSSMRSSCVAEGCSGLMLIRPPGRGHGEGDLPSRERVQVPKQMNVIQRKPGTPTTPASTSTPSMPKSAAIRDVMAFYARLSPLVITQYYVVDGNLLTIHDKEGKSKAAFTLERPGLVNIKGYYLGNPFFGFGWTWIWESSKGALEVRGLSQKAMAELAKPTSTGGEVLSLMDQELTVLDWIKDADIKRFWDSTERGWTAMAVLNTPLKPLAGGGREGPVLTFTLPPWFKTLKDKVDERIAQDRKADKGNPALPERILFYGSDKVQAQRSTDAWTIEVQKDKRSAFLTVQKQSWDAASDKTVYAEQVTQDLYRKVKLIVDDTKLKKDEQKEITEIDGTGEKKKGSKWAWALVLKKQIETLLFQQKAAENAAPDFPDKLTLAAADADQGTQVHLRIWVYDDRKDASPGALPELKGGTLPTPLQDGDKAENWAPIVRKAAAALRKGAVTTGPSESMPSAENASVAGESGALPAYPALIHPRDMNPDRTTATIATNQFRMVINTAAVHGSNLLNLATIHMGMNIGYSWKVYPLPAELKALQDAAAVTGSTGDLLAKTNDYLHTNWNTLGTPTANYDIDFDWDQSISMSQLGEGDFLVCGKASISYPSDWNMRRQPSLAGLPIKVKKAEALAAQAANADSEALKKLKAQLANELDDKKKQSLLDQIKDLEARESSDLLSLTRKDAAETQRLIKKAAELKKFIADDRARKLVFSGTKDYDPFMFRLKAFDKDLYALYILVRQVFDFRYDDIYAIDEYTKLIEQQYKELQALDARTVRLTDNPKLRTDLPQYRSVAGLVREDDGNLVPVIIVVGHHVESNPAKNKHKILLMDVTFDAPKKGDMTYAGGERDKEEDAVKSAFVKFGEDNKYGNGKVVYRVPQKGYRDEVDSVTKFTEYLGYALAVIGIVLLIAGAILSAGTLAPTSAAAVGGIVTALGISAGVAGAVLAGRNIYKRKEKGTFELDAEFALDVIAIIGAAVQVVGTVGKISTLSRGIGAAQKLMQVQRLEKLLVVYGAVELGGNAILVGLKVKEDVDAVKALHLPPQQEDEMMQQIAMEAVQQGAMLAFASFSHAKDIVEHVQTKVEHSRYKSFLERGWVDEHGKPTDQAPPSLREHAIAPGKPPGKAAQGEQAWKETQVLPLAAKDTADKQHKLTVTENGRIIRCSEFCTDLRLKFGKIISEDPALNSELAALETRAKQAAAAGDKVAADKVVADAALFEGKLKQTDDLRQHLFGMTDAEVDAAFEAIEPGQVTGGPKTGHRTDGRRIPRRQRNQIDVAHIMTDAELKDLGKGGFKRAHERIGRVMGKKISDIPELKKHWEAARAKVLKGKLVTDYSREEVNRGMYKSAQRKFWENVRKDPTAVEFLKAQGFEFEGDSGAALAVLGPQGKAPNERGAITNQERRISLDHIAPKAQGENWKRALDADNLELMFHNANSLKENVQVKFGMRETTP